MLTEKSSSLLLLERMHSIDVRISAFSADISRDSSTNKKKKKEYRPKTIYSLKVGELITVNNKDFAT